MSSPIDKIALSNFKAFYGESTITLGGKHLLLFGENGSGKSSIYWALYSLLQSATKTETEIKKYFTPDHKEQLINHHFLKEHSSFAINSDGEITNPRSIGSNAFVEIDLMDGTSIVIDGSSGLTIHRETDPNVLSNLNRYSDFISHRLLINFYNFRNSKEINLWEVFVRDIFPFLLTDLGSGTETLGQVLKEIKSSKPFFDFRGGNFKVRRKDSRVRQNYESRISILNQNINEWISEINRLVNDFYNAHFRENGDIELRIALEYSKELVFGDIIQTHHHNRRDYQMPSKRFVELNNPFIKLKVWHKDDRNNWIAIDRPQTYFNEAKLTQIALSVRFSLLDDSIRPPFSGQFLALDDLLNSLDMNNRNKVMDILLGTLANKFKIYLFTHDKRFFDFVQLKIEEWDDKGNWEVKEMYSSEDYKPVVIEENIDFIDKGKAYFRAYDYYSAGNNIRKAIEKKLEFLLPDTIRITTRDLEHELKQLFDFYDESSFGNLINDTTRSNLLNYKDIVFNPSSHFDLRSPLYKIEIEKAFEVFDILNTIPKISRHLLVGMRGNLVYRNDERDYTANFILRENLYASYIAGQPVRLSNPKHSILTYTLNGTVFLDPATGASKTPEQQSVAKNQVLKLADRPSRIEHFINPTTNVDLTDFTLADGTSLQALIDQIST